MTPGSKPRSTTPNMGASGPSGPKVGIGQYPPYTLGGARAGEHLSPYNNVASSPYGRPPLMSYDGHSHTRTPGMTTNGLSSIPGGKPYVLTLLYAFSILNWFF